MTLRIQIIKWLAYFDVFHHPLKDVELASLCESDWNVLKKEIDGLIKDQVCFQFENFFSMNSSVEKLVNERKSKENEAKKYLLKLPRYTKLISKFPFVRGVAVSGSLSKNVMYKDGDIDYFIITSTNRLWLCRTFLILFKKLFLLNSRKYFCLNYFVDEKNLKIPDENIFTAVEIAYLYPVYNNELFNRLKLQNEWTHKFIPNLQAIHPSIPISLKNKKSILERLLSGKLGEQLDVFCMRLTYTRWQKKFPNFPKIKFDQTMRSERGVSKHHPKDFQTKVLSKFEENFKSLNINNESIIQS